MINIYLLILITIIIHELGHYLAFRLCGKKPSIKFTWFGIVLGDNIWYSLNPKQMLIITASGVLTGLCVINLSNNYEYILIYLIGCCIDLTNIIAISSIPKKYKDLSLFEINKIQLKETALKHNIKLEMN